MAIQNLHLLIVLAAVLVVTSSTCRKENASDSIRGKLVHRSCATIAVEVLDSAHFHLGQANWQQDASRPVRHNVFAVFNSCEFPQMDTGKIFNFNVVTNGRRDCIVCAMWDNPPGKVQEIKVLP